MFEIFFSGIGIDISEHHVRIAHVGCFGRVKQTKEFEMDEGIVVDEKIVKPDELNRVVQNGVMDMGVSLKRVRTVCLIPESRVFSTSFLLPRHLSALAFVHQAKCCAQKEIPILLDDAKVAISKGAEEEGCVRTTVYAVQTPVFDGLISAFPAGDCRLIAIEANTKAVFRLFQSFGLKELRQASNDQCFGVFDIGNSWATFAFYTKAGSSIFSRTIFCKKSSHKILVDAACEAMKFFDGKELLLTLIVLSGAESADPKLKDAFTSSMKNIPVVLLHDCVNSTFDEEIDIQKFGAAIGAAWRAARPHKFSYQHNFLDVI